MARAPIVPADTAGIARAAGEIRAGGVVIYPTETVYGLGADPLSPKALDRVFEIKGREAEKALILLIRGREDLEALASKIPRTARKLMQSFWPGPLTLVFRAHPELPRKLLGGGDTVALRVSGAPAARALLHALGGPLTSTSANPSGAPPARSARDAASELGARVDLILDGGPAADVRPSTLVDVSTGGAEILREGRISKQEIRHCVE